MLFKKIKPRLRSAAVLGCILSMLTPVSAQLVCAAPGIEEASYERKGIVEVDFLTRVQYNHVKVTVKDSSGKAYKAVIVDKDSDDIDFQVKNYKEGKKYTYKITGIRARGEKKYGSVSGTFRIPKKTAKPQPKEIEYDRKDREVSFEFPYRVKFSNPVVTIKDGSKTVSKKITDIERDEIEVSVKKLTPGKTYSYTIQGIRHLDGKSYRTISGKFQA
ncbi:MAG: hypothetical protein IJ860_04790 [Eubacterium sp.]|nr:hypothetical protein [Eubacterium sp.]